MRRPRRITDHDEGIRVGSEFYGNVTLMMATCELRQPEYNGSGGLFP